ncbi:hypothetical protein H4R34_002011 [Dimargaris verticillata]|uniref:Cation efflux protein transmembrane domain-containing protein n=1 Tax=Dimargaris verticillata TaxID=2761393 RepID=A0A9W8ED97_9FUNG|nr:hypothetical protein H4R34_002011 [Dimargaris verticillata]
MNYPVHVQPPPVAKLAQFGNKVRRPSYAMDLLRQILQQPDSRQIFYFMLLNLTYMFVQLIYGVWSNSLGLISDAIHMLFDCLALGIGLVASILRHRPADHRFTLGYGRIEVLSGFANGVLLLLISVFIIFEAIERLLHPSPLETHQLLLVSVGGLVVNLVGIFAFNHGHVHGHCHSHSEPAGSQQHHHDHGHDHHHDANMQGIFLHILADTMGSVGVIISTLLIQRFGWSGFDPLASILIATLIFLSAVPLVRQAVHQLLLPLPSAHTHHAKVDHALQVAQQLPYLPPFALTHAHLWSMSQDRRLIASLHVEYTPSSAAKSDNRASQRAELQRELAHIVRHQVPGLETLYLQVTAVDPIYR